MSEFRRADDVAEDMSPAHQLLADRIDEVVQDLELHVHPEIALIVDVLKGPIDPLTGQRRESEGMAWQVRKLTQRTELGAAQWTAIVVAVITGVFALLESTIGVFP